MAVDSGGAGGGGGVDDSDWDDDVLSLAILAATEDGDSSGPSVQQSGNFGESHAMHDQFVGKLGPMIGEWNPEKGSRLIQEF